MQLGGFFGYGCVFGAFEFEVGDVSAEDPLGCSLVDDHSYFSNINELTI